MISVVAFATALNLASVEDLAIVSCFFDDHEIRFGLEKRRYVLVDRQSSRHPAQSASEKAMMFIVEDLLNTNQDESCVLGSGGFV